MTPVEKLEAAIAKLEFERGQASKEPWILAGGNEYLHPLGLNVGSEFTSDVVISPEDADLIVTLHRTIDAQLDLLRTARGIAGAGLTGDFAELMAEHGLQLADSILGGA